MVKNKQLDDYLARLDKALGSIPISERADIITEIKSHILEASERDPNQSLTSILNSLGEPESVANKYLLEKGLKPVKPSRSPIVKWLTIGFVSTVALLLGFILIVIWFFTPIINVDEKNGRVQIMGGLIDINAKEGSIDIDDGQVKIGTKDKARVSGNQNLEDVQNAQVELNLTQGSFEIETNSRNQVEWECQMGPEQQEALTQDYDGKVFKLNFEKAVGVTCDVSIPKVALVRITGTNGLVNISEPNFAMDVQLINGLVNFEPNNKLAYNYDTSIETGFQDQFTSSNEPTAIPIKIKVTNGSISLER